MATCGSRFEQQFMNAQERAQQLMHACLPYAEQRLAEDGGFLPYAGVMTNDEQVHLVEFVKEDQDAEAQEVYDQANKALRAGAQEGRWTTTALITDVTVRRVPEENAGEEELQAVSFALDDNEGNSVEVFFPYNIVNGQVSFGVAFAQQGAFRVFGHNA